MHTITYAFKYKIKEKYKTVELPFPYFDIALNIITTNNYYY